MSIIRPAEGWAAVRYSLISLARAPALMASVLAIVAIGAGANTAMIGFIGGLTPDAIDSAAPDAADRFRRVAVLLAAVSLGLLLVVCATVGGLLVARARTRAHEMAVRIALGAGQQSVTAIAVADGAVISLLGGAAGGVLGYWTLRLFPLLFYAEDADHLIMAPDVRWIAVGAIGWTAAILLAACAPLVTVSRVAPWPVLTGQAAVSTAGWRLRGRLSVAQFVMCSLLLMTTTWAGGDIRRTLRTPRGLDTASLLVVPTEASRPYVAEIHARVARLPEVAGVAWVSSLPAGRLPSRSFAVERRQTRTRRIWLDASTLEAAALGPDEIVPVAGRLLNRRDDADAPRAAVLNEAAANQFFQGRALGRLLQTEAGVLATIVGVIPGRNDGDASPEVYLSGAQTDPAELGPDRPFLVLTSDAVSIARMAFAIVSPEYFQVLDDPVVEGRGFDGDDDTGTFIAVVSREAADSVFGGAPIGTVLVDPFGRRIRVVGVVEAPPVGAAEHRTGPLVLIPLGQDFARSMTLVVEGSGEAPGLADVIGDVLVGTSGGHPLTPVTSFDAHLTRYAQAPERIVKSMIDVASIIALVVSLIGVAGAMTDWVVCRRPELALRVALGERPARLVRRVVASGLRLAFTGLGTGVAVVMVAGLFVEMAPDAPLLPSVSMLAVSGLAVALLVSLSCMMPARRATMTDPREALR